MYLKRLSPLSSHVSLYSNLKDGFSSAVLSSGYKANFIVLFLRAREEPLLTLLVLPIHLSNLFTV